MLLLALPMFIRIGGSWFILPWVVVVLGIIGYHGFNIVTGKGYTETIEKVNRYDQGSDKGGGYLEIESTSKPVAVRLKELDTLHANGAISGEEHAEQRRRVLGQI